MLKSRLRARWKLDLIDALLDHPSNQFLVLFAFFIVQGTVSKTPRFGEVIFELGVLVFCQSRVDCYNIHLSDLCNVSLLLPK